MKKKTLIFVSLCLSMITFAADDAAEVINNLKEMPRPWKKPTYNPKPEEECYPYNDWSKRAYPNRTDWKIFEAALKYWGETSKNAKLEKVTETMDGDPIYCMTVTDFSVPTDQKFHIFVGSTHGGPERNGMQSCMALLDYLVSSEAAPYLKKFEFKVMPSLNPAGVFRGSGYQNSRGREIKGGNSWDIKKLELLDPKTVPELVAYKKIMDEFHPEIVLDCHGFDPEFHGAIMTQAVMGSGGDQVVRSWSNALLGAMHDAANATGMPVFPYEEEELQRLISSRTARDAHPRRFRQSYDSVETIMYPYLKYHSLPILPEVGFDNLIVNCIKGLFSYTDNLPAKNHRGLPVDNILADWSGRMVQSYGVTPGERRKSRVELWGKVDNIHAAVLYPQASYHSGFAVMFGKKGYSEMWGDQPFSTLFRLHDGKALENRKDDENFSWTALRQFFKLGPERFFMNSTPISVNFQAMAECEAPQNGVTLAADIPVSGGSKVKMLDVRLNGKSLRESATDGYEVFAHKAGHRIFINVPPEKSRKLNLYVVTYAYNSDAKQSWGWKPSEEILARAKQVQNLPPAKKSPVVKFSAINPTQKFSFDLRPEVIKPAGLKLNLGENVVCADNGTYNMQQAYKLDKNARFISAILPESIKTTDDIAVSFNVAREQSNTSWAFFVYNEKRQPWLALFCDMSGRIRLFNAEKKYDISHIKLAANRSYTIQFRYVAKEGKAYVTVGEEQFSTTVGKMNSAREMRWDVQPQFAPVLYNAISFQCGAVNQ